MSNDKKSEFLEIVAKDIIELNEDTVDNDLKGVLRARLRARADSVIESVGFYSPRGEHAAAIFYICCKPLTLVKYILYSKYVNVVTHQDPEDHSQCASRSGFNIN